MSVFYLTLQAPFAAFRWLQAGAYRASAPVIPPSAARYGLPFAGENNLLFDAIDVAPEAPPTYWYERVATNTTPRRGSCRLTVGIHRSDSSRTETGLFAPVAAPLTEPPNSAWSWVPRQPAKDTVVFG